MCTISLILLIMRAIAFGTVIMFGATGRDRDGEIRQPEPGRPRHHVPGRHRRLWRPPSSMSSTAAEPNRRCVCMLIALSAPLLASVPGRPDLQLPDHLPAGQPERHRSGADHLRHAAWPTSSAAILNRLAGGVGQISVATTSAVYRAKIPGAAGPGRRGQAAVQLRLSGLLWPSCWPWCMHWFLNRTRTGLNLRAVGENPATADAAGINVTTYKYLATCIGAGISRPGRPVLRHGLHQGHLGQQRHHRVPWAGWPWRWSSSPPGGRSTPSGVPTCSACCTGCISSYPRCWASRWPAT